MIASTALAFAVLLVAHEPTPSAIRASVERALPQLKVAAETHAEKKACFACHNQTYPMLAFDAAEKLGFAPDAEFVREQVKHIRAFVTAHRKEYDSLAGTGGHVDTAGWLLAALEVAGEKPDEDTTAIVKYILNRHADRKHWTTSSNRPPTQVSSFASSYLAIRSLKKWGTEEQKAAIEKRIEATREWALKTKPKETEDRVYRLRLLHLSGAASSEVASAAKELLDDRRPDGGWAQLPKAESDAYATATALVALADTGHLSPKSKEYRRGVEYLLRTQQADGTWHVKTRAVPIQTYFEAGYPHGKDQFISVSAASWSVMALAKAWEK